MSLIVFLFSLLLQLFLFCRKGEAAATAFVSKPSDPSYAQEGYNISTLVWTYTLNGGIGLIKFVNVTGGASDSIATKFGGGNTNVQAGYQERFRAEISDSQAQLTILTVQRSDKGTFKLDITDPSGGIIAHGVDLIVQYPPSIIDISRNQTVNDGEIVTLNCSADGDPTPDITWTKDNSVVNSTIHITGKHNEGTYRCTANNSIGNVSADVFINVQNYRPFNTNLTTNLTDNTVVMNTNFNLICSAQANPLAKYRFYRGQESLSNTTTGNTTAVYTTSVDERVNQVNYKCTPFNDYGETTVTITVTVHYPPEIDSAPSSQSVIEGNDVTLFCNATGNPQPSIEWTKQGSNTVLSTSETLPLTNLMRGDNGAVYKCKVQNSRGSEEANATITVLYEPSVTIQQCSTPVNESGNVTLYCNATGNPVPNTAWIRASTREVVSYNKMHMITAIKRNESDNYTCIAWNGIGNNSTASCPVDVHYPPEITKPETPTKSVNAKENATIECLAEGNPTPEYVWKNASGAKVSTDRYLRFTDADDSDGGNYTCFATNNLSSVSFTILVKVTRNETPTLELTVEKQNGVDVEYLPEYADLNSALAKDFVDSFKIEVDTLYSNDSNYNRTNVTGLRNGSVIVSFILYFTTPVTTDEALAKLRAAVNKGELGQYTVGNLKIIQDVNPTTATTVTQGDNISPSSTAPVCTSFIKTKECDLKLGMIVGFAVAGVAVIAVVIGIVAWWVHKRRKCRRDPRTHHCDDAQRLQGDQNSGEENAYSHVNGGYAHSGPPSANGGAAAPVQQQEQQGAAASPNVAEQNIPQYAVVDKKKKKDARSGPPSANVTAAPAQQQEQQGAAASPNVAEQNIPQYAVVNKKKKKEVDDTYAQVDMSKKSKKKPKPKPGEVLYADLGDFQQPKQMPSVSTSPVPLPPIKRPAAYEETQYADITQYLKGDAALPASNNSQGTEMESAYANVEGDGGKSKETKM